MDLHVFWRLGQALVIHIFIPSQLPLICRKATTNSHSWESACLWSCKDHIIYKSLQLKRPVQSRKLKGHTWCDSKNENSLVVTNYHPSCQTYMHFGKLFGSYISQNKKALFALSLSLFSTVSDLSISSARPRIETHVLIWEARGADPHQLFRSESWRTLLMP